MKSINRQTATPLGVPRSNRNHMIAVLTSLPAGKCVPILAIPMLREDAMSGRVNIAVEMQETAELLMNPVHLRVTAYVVPWLAMERFEGSRDEFDKSYAGVAGLAGDVIPFFEKQAMGTHGSNAVYKALGMHAKPADEVNTMYLEAYNAIWNFRAQNRSKDITLRTRLDATLAPAFWQHSRFAHVVPDFDQAVIDGEVALNVVESRLPISGLGVQAAAGSQGGATVKDTTTDQYGEAYAGHVDSGSYAFRMRMTGSGAASLPDVYAEMQANGITVSLSNIEMARKTQAFAKLREQFVGHDDEYIIDMLMDGLTIPDQSLKQPILIADQTQRFGQAKRYATDAGNLAESAVSGASISGVSLRVPKLNTGGVVIVMAECVPEQLFERQRDPFLFTSSPDELPEYLRDTLDPEKVDVVLNGEIDTDHDTPNSTFGYAPMNWKWNASGPKVGGKFYRPTVDGATDEERQRLWAVEVADPVLSDDFYIVSGMHQKPFLDLTGDPFEASAMGNCVINGNTVFGGVLVEAMNNYDAVAAKAPTDRIEKE